jgi:hypothetical protein
MYRDLALAIFTPGDSQADRAVDLVRARHPDLSDEAVAGRLVGQAAWRCAAVGALSCAGMELAGRVITGVDFSYQAVSLYRLAASVARAHGRETTLAERAAAAAGSLAFAGAAELVRRGGNACSRRLLGRRAPGLAVIVSALAGGAVGYASARTFARVWRDALERRNRRRLPWL